ncbi:MAG: Trk family potassium uptake protein [Clostridia bacterium]|nr:Trk family potassium uptake protein [Clostridia bacterium]
MDTKKVRRLSPVGILFLGYALIILFGSALLSFPFASASGTSHAYIDCLFTSVSATCVTGLVPFDTALSWSLFGQIVILLLIQIGGLGFMTFITLFYFLFDKRVGLHSQNVLMHAQGSSSRGEILPLIRKILIVTFSTELVGTGLLSVAFYPLYGSKGLYYALFTSVSAFCNAGFDVFGTGSLTSFSGNSFVLIVIALLILIGGFGFFAIEDLFRKKFRFRKFTLHTKVVVIANAVLIVGGTLFFYLMEFTNIGIAGTYSSLPVGEKILNAFFMAVSPRTAGFNALDLTKISGTSQFFTVLLMFVGGNSCSTAGGIKVTTMVVVFANLRGEARGKDEVVLLRSRVSDGIVKQAGAILLSYLVLAVCSVLVLGIVEPVGFIELLFEVVSAMATVGLTLNLTPTLGIVSKLVLIFLMYVGRLGAFTLFELIFRQKKKDDLSRLEGKIMVG